MELTLTVEERELLLEILGERHCALLREISHTDHREFKLALRKREKLLESVVNRLRVCNQGWNRCRNFAVDTPGGQFSRSR